MGLDSMPKWQYDDEDMGQEGDVSEDKWAQRDRKIAKRSKTMRVDGRSVFVIQQSQHKRDQQKRGSK
jgi:hypothetical protein